MTDSKSLSCRSMLADDAVVWAPAFGPAADPQDSIEVGVLHPLSGTMAICATTLKVVMLMLIEEQSRKSGLLGKKREALVFDPTANRPLFAMIARERFTRHKALAKSAA